MWLCVHCLLTVGFFTAGSLGSFLALSCSKKTVFPILFGTSQKPVFLPASAMASFSKESFSCSFGVKDILLFLTNQAPNPSATQQTMQTSGPQRVSTQHLLGAGMDPSPRVHPGDQTGPSLHH